MSEALDSAPDRRGEDASLAAAYLAIDPLTLGGVAVRTDRSEVCECWLQLVHHLSDQKVRLRKVPPHIDDERLLGGMDLTASLHAGRSVQARGLLAEAAGDVIVVSMAERVSDRLAASLASVLDRRGIAVIALDSGQGEDEFCSPILTERLAMQLDLRGIEPDALSEHEPLLRKIARARDRLNDISFEAADLRALCATAAACGIDSLRAPLWALHVARVSAALRGEERLRQQDLENAVRLVLAPRARVMPASGDDAAPADVTPAGDTHSAPADEGSSSTSETAHADEELLVAAARAAVPADLLASGSVENARLPRGRRTGRAGAILTTGRRGRPAGIRAGRPRGDLKLNVVATLRCAAPWQRQRHQQYAAATARVLVRVDDFRLTYCKPRSETATVFVLDASGSSAMSRLAEAKGAIELLLAECYVRRDQVAVIAFRGRGAQLILPPTRSLVRAKRSLAQLAGGGATPLAAGVDLGRQLADQLRRRGMAPILVLLTDGQANVARDGTGGRTRAAEDAVLAARSVSESGLKALLIDTARRPQTMAQSLAQTMRARYMPLPYADARALLGAVKSAA